jgi:Flp pilus assembly protein TadG
MSPHARPALDERWRHALRGLGLFRDFLGDRRGNIAILFGLALVPIVGAMGVAVDYSFANQSRTRMQAALDFTALSLSKMMPLAQADLDTRGRQIFLANLGKTPLTIGASNIAEQMTITPALGKITLRVNTEYPIKMAGVLSPVMPREIPIGSHTEVVWGQGKVEVALALDNTGSMASSGKLTQLIAAAHNLIDILKNAAQQPGDAKVAVVPFGFQVSVDKTANVGASWLRWDLWEEDNGSCSNNNYDTKSDCTSHNKTWTANPHSDWNGCIADRDKDPQVNYDVNDASVTSATATKFPAAQDPVPASRRHTQNDCGSLATVMPLNYNWGEPNSIDPTTLHGKINSMNAVGNTNVTIGLDWAFQMVSPTDTLPFSLGAAYGTENLTKYVVILTDGDNTQNRFTTNSSQIDTRTTAACNAIKAKGIKIYSIRVLDGNATLLRNCASDPSMYFSVTDASQLAGVFNVIGTTIANLHLSQ